MKRCEARKAGLVFMLILGAFVALTGCGRWNEPASGDGNPLVSTTTVSSTAPGNGAEVVAVGNKLTVTFSEPMDPATFTETTFTLRQGATPVPGTVSYSGVTAIFTPDVALEPGTVYDAAITTGARDPDGAALPSDYQWSFTTGAGPDLIAPTVIRTVPAQGGVAVPAGNKLSATFSEPMDPETVGTSFTLQQGTTGVPGTVSYSGVTAVFTPATGLVAGLSYSATIARGAKDLGGNPLGADVVWSFTAGGDADVTEPTMSSTAPATGATGVAVGNKLSVTFSEPMNPLTISTSTFVLRQGSATVPGSVHYSGVNANFTPAAVLLPGTVYTATITTGATDLGGNALAEDFVWSFTTRGTPDTTRPTVLSTTPGDGSADVIINTKVTANFSEAMDPLTINPTTFAVKLGAATVPGSVSSSNGTAVFTPAGNLQSGQTYSATISTGAKDLAGNALAADLVWSFTTGAPADAVRPTITRTVPVHEAIGVSVNQRISATFSEGMDPTSITTATFTLKKGALPVVGTVAYNVASSIATFTPKSPLALGTTYTALITTGATDLAGNALQSGLVPNAWRFTTALPLAQVPVVTPAVDLGTIDQFAAVGGKGITSSGNTLITGDVSTTSASTLVVGLTDGNGYGNSYSISGNPGIVNGKIYTAPPAPGDANSMAVAVHAQQDAQIAYDATSPAAMPGGVTQTAELGALTLAPGVYWSGSSFGITTVDLTLDAQGDPNASWVFQTDSTLTVGTNVKVILANGAQAGNVFWHVASAATINAGAQMKGTILAATGVSMGTGARLDGRAISLVGGPVTLLGNVITVP